MYFVSIETEIGYVPFAMYIGIFETRYLRSRYACM